MALPSENPAALTRRLADLPERAAGRTALSGLGPSVDTDWLADPCGSNEGRLAARRGLHGERVGGATGAHSVGLPIRNQMCLGTLN